MGKQAIDGKRSDVFFVQPEQLTIVEDPGHALYDERALHDPCENLIKNISVYGIIEPVIVTKEGDKILVVAGRQRVKAAIVANKLLESSGEMPIRVPVILRRGDEKLLSGVMISENEIRRSDDALTRAEKTLRLTQMGHSAEELAIAFGVTTQSIANWLKLNDCCARVKKAVRDGLISATAASKFAGLSVAEQEKLLSEMLSDGGKPTVEKASRKAKGLNPPKEKSKRKSTKEIAAEIENAPNNLEGDYLAGYVDALQWVLGELD